MKSFWLLLLIFQNARTALVTWDFGADIGGLTVISLQSGVLKNKEVQVSFPVPPCMDVKYVRVEVRNMAVRPEVTYNKETQTVTITYDYLDPRQSTYKIVAKGSPNKACGINSATRLPDYHQNPGSYYGHPPNGGQYDPNGHHIFIHYPNYGDTEYYSNTNKPPNDPKYKEARTTRRRKCTRSTSPSRDDIKEDESIDVDDLILTLFT